MADAVIGNVQEQILKEYGASNCEMVFYSHSIGLLYLSIALSLSGKLPAAVQVAQEVKRPRTSSPYYDFCLILYIYYLAVSSRNLWLWFPPIFDRLLGPQLGTHSGPSSRGFYRCYGPFKNLMIKFLWPFSLFFCSLAGHNVPKSHHDRCILHCLLKAFLGGVRLVRSCTSSGPPLEDADQEIGARESLCKDPTDDWHFPIRLSAKAHQSSCLSGGRPRLFHQRSIKDRPMVPQESGFSESVFPAADERVARSDQHRS